MQGQELCVVRRGVRRAIAEANNLPVPEISCDRTDCIGNCEISHEEQEHLESLLLEKQKSGKPVRYAGQLQGLKGTWKTRTVIPYPEEYTRKFTRQQLVESEQEETERYEKELKALQEYHRPTIPEDVVMSLYVHDGLFNGSEYTVKEHDQQYLYFIKPSSSALKFRQKLNCLWFEFPIPESAVAEIAEAFAPAETWEEFYPLEEIIYDCGSSRVYCRYRYHVLSTDESFHAPLPENHSTVMSNIKRVFADVCKRYYTGDEWDVLKREFRF